MNRDKYIDTLAWVVATVVTSCITAALIGTTIKFLLWLFP